VNSHTYTKDYLKENLLLDQRILSEGEDLRMLQEVIRGVPDAPVSLLMQEKEQKEALEALIRLRGVIRDQINAEPNGKTAMILRYRFIHGLTLKEISMEMCIPQKTVERMLYGAAERINAALEKG